MLILSSGLIPYLDNDQKAYAKILPSSRPDIEITILESQEEFENEEGGIERRWDYMTDDTFEDLGSDIKNLPVIFDVVATSAIRDFVEDQKSELAGKYVDTLFVRYRPYNNETFVSIWYTIGTYQNMTAVKLPEEYALKVADEIQFKIAILKQFPNLDENYQEWVDFNILEYNLLPHSSVRVAYLSDRLYDEYLQSKGTLVKRDVTLSLPEREPIIIESVSAVMFEEMSRLQIRYMDRLVGQYGGIITKFDTWGGQLVPLRSFVNEALIKPNTPVFYWKMSNVTTTLYATLHTLGSYDGAWLEYPYGKQVSINPIDTTSIKFSYGDDVYEQYTTVKYEVTLDKDEPIGMYKILIKVPEQDLTRAWIGAYSQVENPEELQESSELEPTAEQFEECQGLGIDGDRCSDTAILQERHLEGEDRKLLAYEQDQLNVAMYMIGIGAAIAGVTAFVTLRGKTR